MAIDKGLYAAPGGLEALGQDEEEIEIEVVLPEEDDDEIINLLDTEEEEGFDDNLAEYMDDSDLQTIANELLGDFEEDVGSRKDWIQTYVDGLELLGLRIEERSEPWEGACGVYHPLLAEALVKFQAETIMATFPAAGPVKTEIIGKDTQDKKDAAVRVAADMNYQLTDVMIEYRPEHERMIWGLGLAGNAFKKVYEDPSLGRQVSMYVPAEDLVMPYGASSIESAERVSHVMRKTENEIKRLQVSGFYRDVDLGDPVNSFDEVEKKIAEKMGFKATTDDRFKLIEMNVNYDLPGYEDEDGIALPYIITMEKNTQTVLSIRRNWKENDPLKNKRQHFVHYVYIPGFGIYAFGLIHLVGAFAKSGTSLIRQLVDAGTLSNLPGGFKARGLRVIGDDTPIAPGEFRDVDVPSGSIKDNLMTLPYKEPSQVLLTLLNQIVEDGRRFASTADLQSSDMSANAPVGTTLAILERTLKSMSAIQARVHYAMKQELRLLKLIIAENAPEDYNYDPEIGSRKAKKSDYEHIDVIPVSDPNAATMAQKIVQYQAVLQLAQQAPQIYNLPMLHRQMLDVLGVKNANKLVELKEDAMPLDPVSENMNFLKGKPATAFIFQDQDAHIASHQSFLQDPAIAAAIGQNPLAQQMQAAGMAHIAEHLAFQYRQKMQEQLGVALPPPDKPLPPDIEVQLSQSVAMAGQQLLKLRQGQAAQAKIQAQAQDPVVQMQQKELELQAQDVARKAQKDKDDIEIKRADILLKAHNSKDPGFDPLAAAQQEQQQQQAAQQQQLAAQQQQQQAGLQQAAQQQKMMQQDQLHQQKLAHGGRVNEIKQHQELVKLMQSGKGPISK